MASQTSYQMKSLHPSRSSNAQDNFRKSDALDIPTQQSNYGNQSTDSTLAIPSNVSLNPSVKPYVSRTSEQERLLSRTPSPTPSEIEALNENGGLGITKYLNPKFWFRKDRILFLVLIIAGIVITILFAVYDKQIVVWFEPTAQKIHALPAGFLIPVAILVVLSIPPLFGHELIEILCGFIYGTGIGFAIVCVGVLIGELVNFVGFKYFCTTRGRKLEIKNIRYGSLAQVVRDGGFIVALVIRYSIIPAHFSTAVFATAGMNIFVFAAAAILSLPKRFITVYVGSVLAQDNEGDETQAQIHKNNLIERIVLVVTIIITIFAVRYIRGRVNAVKPDVIYRRRKFRQRRLQLEHTSTGFRQAEGGVFVNVQPATDDEGLGQPVTSRVVAPQPQARAAYDLEDPPRYS